MGLHHSPRIITSGLVLALDAADINSYPGTGTTWYNLAGDVDATLANTPTYTTSHPKTFTFDGVNERASIAGIAVSDWITPFSMEVWFNVPTGATWTNGYRSTIFGQGGSYAGTYGIVKHPTEGQVTFYIRGDNGGIGANITGLSRDTWHQVVGVWNGTNCYIYHNGELVTGPTGSARTGVPDTTNLFVGIARAYSGATGAYFEGDVSIAKYYNSKALTSDEVLQNYNATKTRFGL